MPAETTPLFERIASGRTDLVFDYLAAGNPATATDINGVSLTQHCAYYGDVSAIRHLLANGASLSELGDDLGLNGACFHGHWRLAQFLLEQGVDPNRADPETGETPLHSALCTTERIAHNRVMRVLLAHRADPNHATKDGAETGGFMRDVRTCGETAPPPSVTKKRSACCSMPEQRSTPKMLMVTRRSVGQAGTCARTPSCACSCMAASASARNAAACANTSRANPTSLGHTVIGKTLLSKIE